MSRKTISVDYLARVEGEGGLKITIRDGAVESAELNIFEPPRFFEAFLRGRHFTETPDIVARICGICPVAYQMSAVHALENLMEVTLPEPLRQLRRLLYCGEWIESHVLHIYMLHAPDFLGYAGGVEMAILCDAVCNSRTLAMKFSIFSVVGRFIRSMSASADFIAPFVEGNLRRVSSG
jgi:coenzyme F420-reducing hydrogenase alpha subunit